MAIHSQMGMGDEIVLEKDGSDTKVNALNATKLYTYND